VSGGSVSELAFGMAVGASDGSDDVLDRSPVGGARGNLPSTILRGRDGVPLWRDVRGVSDCAVWLTDVRAAEDSDCVLSWSPEGVPAEGLRLVEADETGEVLAGGIQLDMSVEGSLTFSAGDARFFLIVYGQREWTLTLASGWNLISFPFSLWSSDLDEVLGDLAVFLPVWEWTGELYVAVSDGGFQPKRGYWVYVLPGARDAVELDLTGLPCWDETAVVTPGTWDLVGALEECTKPVGSGNMVSLWQWQASAQRYAEIYDGALVPEGKGFWLFFSGPGGQQLIDLTSFEFVSQPAK